MTPPLEFRAWDKFNKIMLDDGEPLISDYNDTSTFICLPDINSLFTDESFIWMQYTGHRSIDNQKVFNRDLLKFPDNKEVYEVRWDNDEGGWGIFYKGMNAFRIGMARFMVVAGNTFEGIEENKEAK